jgi:hypothetical protein
MQLLQVSAKCVVDAEGRQEHILSALERGLEEFGPSPVHEQEICIVGSGPSVKTQLKKIKKLKRHYPPCGTGGGPAAAHREMLYKEAAEERKASSCLPDCLTMLSRGVRLPR